MSEMDYFPEVPLQKETSLKTPVKTPPESSPLHQMPPGKNNKRSTLFSGNHPEPCQKRLYIFRFLDIYIQVQHGRQRGYVRDVPTNIPGMSILWAKNQVVAVIYHPIYKWLVTKLRTNLLTAIRFMLGGTFTYLYIYPVKKSTISL